MPQDNVYFKRTSTLPDLKGPLSKEVLTVSIIDALVIKIVYFRFCCTCDTNTETQKPSQIFLLGEIVTASQIFGPCYNNPLYSNA